MATPVYAKAIAKAKKVSQGNFTQCNVTPLDATERKTWKSCTVASFTSKKTKSSYLKAKIVLNDKNGTSFTMPLCEHWMFQRGDTLDIDTITLCNLKDAKGKLKLDKDGEPEWYLHGEIE